ncbi:MAG: fumarylacetoacetate hydrolase family protein [Chloroflexi bacterium]|nr:fumarylacetoacetate hydrolase family protein [Chloroflexota bacterium]
MKLVTFAYHDETRIGILVSKNGQAHVLDLNCATSLPMDMVQFLQAGDAAMTAAQNAVAEVDERFLIPQSDVILLAPLLRPGKIICIGYNYRGHTSAALPTHPDIFAKLSNVVIGPHQPIVITRTSQMVDYEGELAVVMGKRCKYVDQAHALDVVAGYTIFNDVTARDFQKRTSQWLLGKSFDTYGPLGPAIVTKEEIPDPSNLDLSLTLNGKEMQHSNTCDMIFPVPYLIECITQALTLEPGDIISTGTPSGTGASYNPPVFMKPGDEVCVRIDKIGELVNPVVSESFD